MNEFTKDELGILLLEMNISIQRTPKQLKVSPVFLKLRDKVESMIDNYCDHDFVPCLAKINIEMCCKPKCLAIK